MSHETFLVRVKLDSFEQDSHITVVVVGAIVNTAETINTSYVERSNLNWRMWDAHLTRKSLMYAKSIRWLRAKFSICVAFYNLIRPHETLSRRNDRRFLPKTPAMAAGVTDHQWTVRELLACKA